MKKIIFVLIIFVCFMACNSSVDKQLDDAIDFGDVKLVKELLAKGANPNLKDSDGDPKLISLAMLRLNDDDQAVFKLLLDAGANPNIAAKDGETALIVASRQGDLSIAKLLLEAGADPNLCDNDGYSALMKASDQGYEEVMKLLLDAGADPNLQQGWKSALYLAILMNRPNAVRILLEAGADPNLHTDDNTTLLKVAQIGHNKEIEQILLQAGAKSTI